MSDINIGEEKNQPPTEVEKTPVSVKKSFLRRAFRFVFKSAVYLLIFLLIASVSLIFLSYSESFRSWSSDIILDNVNSSIEGEIEFTDIRINPFEGVELEDVLIMAAGDTVLYCKQLTVSLQIKPVLDESLVVSKILLDSPRIKLLRSAEDSTWNISHIVAASDEEPDTSKTVSEWTIDVAGIEMINGSFVRYDSTLSENSSGQMDFDHLDAVDINFDISANVDLGKSIYKAEVNSMSFYEKSKDFSLVDLQFAAELTKDMTIIEDMRVLTPKSCVNLDLKLDSTDIIGGFTTDELFNSPLTLKLRIDSGSVSDALKFAQIPLNPLVSAKIQLDLTGSINDPILRNFKVKTGKTELDMDIDVQNSTTPETIQFQLSFNKTLFSVPDARRILLGIDLSSVPDPGVLQLAGSTISGNLDSVSTDFKVITQAGSLNIDAGINLKMPLLYSGKIKCDKLDLGRLLDDVSLKSNVSSVVNFTGGGTNEDNLFADVRLSAGRSQFGEYDLNRLRFKAAVSPGLKVTLDSMLIVFAEDSLKSDDYYDDLPESLVFMNVELDLSQKTSPIYRIVAQTQALDIAKLLKQNNMPEYFTSKVEINASGVHPDSIVGKIEIGIDECYFADRALLPFDMSVAIDRDRSERTILLKSDFVNARLKGNYTVDALTQAATINSDAVSAFIGSIMRTVTPQSDSSDSAKQIVIKTDHMKLPSLSLKLKAEIFDVTPIASLFQLEVADISAAVDMDIFTGGKISRFSINSIKTNNIRIKTNSADLRCDPLKLIGNLVVESNDSLVELTDAYLYCKGEGDIRINDLTIGKPKIKLSVNQEAADFEIQTSINEKTNFATEGMVKINENHLDITINDTDVSYDEYSWQTDNLLNAVIGPEYAKISKFGIDRENHESISLSGSLLGDSIENFTLDISNIKLTDLNKFINASGSNLPQIKSGIVHNISVHTEGKLDNPNIELSLDATNLSYNGTNVGNLSVEMFHRDSTVIGKLNVLNPKRKDGLKTLEVDIKRLPVNLAFKNIKKRLREDKASLSLKANDLPLNLAGSFVPEISKLRGKADATLNLNGYLPDDFDFDGSIKIKNAKFLSLANNIYYRSNAKINLNSEKITVEKLTLHNSKLDLKRGKAEITGFVTLDDKMKPDVIDFSLRSKGIKVLSRASEKSMPSVFGDFVLATGDNPMRAYGKTDALNIQGDLNVVSANLYMPDIDKTNISKSVFKYEIVGDVHQFTSEALKVTDSEDILPVKPKKSKEKSIDDLLDIAVNLRIPGRMYLTIDMISIGRLKIEVGLEDQSQPLGYYKKRGSDKAIITGSGLLVKEGSNLNFIKAFNTTGTIFFPTGSLADPGIDLTAIHHGQSIVKDKPRDYSVKMYITGTKNKPLINFGYAINGTEAIGDSSQIRQDAIFLLISGKTKSDFEVGSMNFTGTGLEAGTGMLSNLLTDAFQGTVIQSAEIDFGNEGNVDMEQARLKISGQLFGYGKWTVGGSVADFSNKNEFSFDYPLTELGNNPVFDNIILQMSYTNDQTPSPTKDQNKWKFKIKLRGSK